MTKKTYRTYRLKSLSLFSRDSKGNRIDVVFHKGVQVDSTARFSTSDPKIQSFLEKCSGFGRDFYLEKEEPIAEAKVAPVKEEQPKVEKPKPEKIDISESGLKDVKRFRNIVEMREAIRSIGIQVSSEAGYSELRAAAAKEGYDYQIQK